MASRWESPPIERVEAITVRWAMDISIVVGWLTFVRLLAPWLVAGLLFDLVVASLLGWL